jgi:unsaturated rhamnogalacturonyl hydrolase
VGHDDAMSVPDADTPWDGGGVSDGEVSQEAGVLDGPGPAAMGSFDWGKAVIDTRIEADPSFGTGYVDGLFLHGLYKAYQRLRDPKYLTVLTSAADHYGKPGSGNLDGIMHMAAVADAYALTKKAAYQGPADETRKIFNTYPTSSDGVFWHGTTPSRAHQLWGDGVFMSLAFLTRYGTEFHDTTMDSIAFRQLAMTAKHLRNPATGLLWHVYDESGAASWVKQPSQTNEIHWGRAMGWFGMATVMTLEAISQDDPNRSQLQSILQDLVAAWAKFQDPATGRWFQVVDQGSDARNWTETSCSSMYSYVTWWAYRHQLVDASLAAVARKGFEGVMKMVTKDGSNRTTIRQICTGLGATGNVADYYSHSRADNDPHGVGAFVLMWEGMQ